MAMIEEYLHYHNKYNTKYGDKMLVLLENGHFFEAYATETRGPDLQKISEILNVTLTKKNKSIDKIDEKNPRLLGVPSICIQKYKKLLINEGYTVVSVTQITSPPNPKRAVTSIESEGTYIEETFSPDSKNIVCLYIENELQPNKTYLTVIGLAVVDLSTGENTVHETHSMNGDEKYALDEAFRFIASYAPKEIIIMIKNGNDDIICNKNMVISYLELDNKHCHYLDINKNYSKIAYQNEFLGKIYKNTMMLSVLEYLDLERMPYATISFIALLDFAYQHNESIINNLFKPQIYEHKKHLILGNNAIFQLNIFETNDIISTRIKSLFDVVNHTSTAMGRRYLKNMLNYPLVSPDKLKIKYDCVEEAITIYENLDTCLKNIIDLERMNRKLCLNLLHPFEFCSFVDSYRETKNLIELIKNTQFNKNLLPEQKVVDELDLFLAQVQNRYNFDEMKKYSINEIENTFYVKNINPIVDKLQTDFSDNIEFMDNICVVLSQYAEDTDKKTKKENTSLKIHLKHNNLEGYHLCTTNLRLNIFKKNIEGLRKIKITNNYNLDPQNLVYKTMKDQTKIYFEDLKIKSRDTKTLTEQIMVLVKEDYVKDLQEYFIKYGSSFKIISEFVAELDFIKSAAKTAKLYNYVKPIININQNNGFINCKELRHPIIERINTSVEYVPHDINLGLQNNNTLEGMLLYGLNAAGKSSLMKAIGVSIIMAQCGMFVPATRFEYSPYESIMARITGSDNIFKGLSSFALEMTELRAILKRSGPKTLVIGDEVCRGTEHISGNSIVAASIIKLSKSGSSFIFATHLHEIVEMSQIKELKNVKAFHLSVDYDKVKDILIFDRKLKEGSGDTIYGITVAKYLIHDDEFIKLAQEIKNDLLNKPNHIIGDKTSNYNSSIYMHECGICQKQCPDSKDHVEKFDSHHINFQSNCINGFVIGKPYLPMNSKSNIIVLCKDCHHKVHHGLLEIKGYMDTSNGRQIVYNELKEKEKVKEEKIKIEQEQILDSPIIKSKTTKPKITKTESPKKKQNTRIKIIKNVSQ